MGYLRFWRRIKIAPGLTLNLSKSGGSLSFGPRGAKMTVGPRGRRATVGIPGTGLFYTQTASGGRRSGSGRRAKAAQAPVVPPESRLTMGFFKRLVTPAGEKAFVDGCRELAQGHYAAALPYFEAATHLTDGAFAAGFLYLKQERTDKAIPLLEQAARDYRELGRYFGKYGLTLTLNLPITEEAEAHVGPTLRGALLTLVEAYQIAENWDAAYECLLRLRKLEPDDVVIVLSMVELLWQANHGNDETCRHIVKLTGNIGNESYVQTALRLYKARALNGLNMHSAARDLLTETLRRRKDRAASLLNALRYERALAYESLGQPKRARADLEAVFADDPDFTDVADRLTMGSGGS
jgi:tetratricopeptide (TPR) repeat protein